ncbi:NAD(P)-dependent oxidoreductase [Acidaminococcus timonensis]|uniref:NAD-dependent epimerase/dehydratase family protein n=1 Tax=Acidaminococcus timonensis TaxID=1871002 RepID=UPI0026EF1983|nr:NAD(P)-dependent oxidoreductase [Acidaminococcus timonensis]
MWIENKIFQEDMENIAQASYIRWEKLMHKTLFITGATGLIGFNLISALAYISLYKEIPLQMIALVRNEEQAKERFREILAAGAPLKFVVGDLENIPPVAEHIDYIIHGGSPTASRYFAEHPVETITINLKSATHLLELARKNRSDGFLFLSSMEVYGGIHCREKVNEKHASFVDTMVPRSSYPEVKRMVESLCACYADEYGVPAKSIRLTQTFGAGIRKGDNRVFAQFAHSAMQHEDIIMFTKGGTERDYLYTADAVSAILTVLLNGTSGEAYNAANEQTYCSIKKMAETVANLDIIKEKYNGPVSVVIDESKNNGKIYPPELYMDLDTRKIQQLGWKATVNLEDMFTRMISMEE